MLSLKRVFPVLTALLWTGAVCGAQQPSPAATSSPDVQEMRAELASTRSELRQYKEELAELREQMRAIQQRLGVPAQPAGTAPSDRSQFPTLSDINQNPALGQAEAPSSDQSLLAAKVAEYEQTKVESVSKYKVRLSGMVLMNTYSNFGTVDVTDLPNRSFRGGPDTTGGDTGATLRQTTLGVQVTGPMVAGARSSADAEVDFYGGLPATHYGASMGAVRLRTARARLDWKSWSLVAGQDTPFFSPLSPTSYATVAEPALSWSGNLWVWQPQIRAERRWSVSERSNVTWSFGMLNTLSEEPPDTLFNRTPDPAEASRMPGLATHFAWNGMARGKAATVGFGGYYGRQNWGFKRNVDSWLITGDFDLPLARTLALSGEIYRGQATGGLGGGIWMSALFDGDPSLAATRVLPLNDVGGWSQLKFRPVTKWEFNAAAGMSNPLAKDLQSFAKPRTYAFPPLARNQTLLVNSIFHPRSNLLFALEYRHLRTYNLTGVKASADHLNLSIGVSF